MSENYRMSGKNAKYDLVIETSRNPGRLRQKQESTINNWSWMVIFC